MAKTKEKITAHNLFVQQSKSQKEIAIILKVTEKTVGRWVKEENWKAERNARFNGTKQRTERIKEVISSLTDDHLNVLKQIKEIESKTDKASKETVAKLRKQSSALSQDIAMQTKALERIDKEYKISLSTYLEVMDDIFEHLREYDKELYLRTLDFQNQHIQHIAQKIG